MTRTKPKLKTVTRSRPVKSAKSKTSKRPAPVIAASGALAKTRAASKNAHVVAPRVIVLVGVQRLKIRDAVHAKHYDFAIDHELPAAVLECGFHDPRIASGPAAWPILQLK